MIVDDKLTRCTLSHANLQFLEVGAADFLRRFVAMAFIMSIVSSLRTNNSLNNEVTLVYTPIEGKHQTVPSAGKVVASVFWDAAKQVSILLTIS
jgi:hypothetical protein